MDEAFGNLETELTDVARGITVELFHSIVTRTPQFYGGMAASWSYNYNGVSYDRSKLIPDRVADPFGKDPDTEKLSSGHMTAVDHALTASANKDQEFKLGRKVYITNGVNFLEGPYSATVEGWTASPPLRSINMPGQPMKRSLDMIQSKYGTKVTKQKAAYLKLRKIGGF